MADQSAPSGAKDAVLVKSEDMPADAQKVEELDFNKLNRPITAHDLFMGMRHMGFQASAMSEAIRIINEMVALRPVSHKIFALHDSNNNTTFRL